MAQARQAIPQVLYNGVDISEDISCHLVNLTFTDNEGSKADDLSITLEDRDGRWRGDWFPSKGATLVVSIILYDWDSPGKVNSYPCGTFEIDQIDLSGSSSGSTVSIKATSTRMSKSARQEDHTRGWENSKLSVIAGDIANDNGLSLFWDSKDDPQLARREQVEQSDLGFLSQLCEEYGIAVKVTDDQLICYSVAEYEAKDAVGTVTIDEVESYRFSTKTNGVYKKARSKYHDPVTCETRECCVTEEELEDE